MNITESSVYKVLQVISPEGLTAKQILIALSQRSNKKTQLRKVLKKLAQKKICHKKDNHYFLHDDHTPPISPRRRGGSPLKSHKTQSTRNLKNQGVFLGDGPIPKVYCGQTKQTLELDPRDCEGLIHGDLIGFSAQSHKKDSQSARLTEIRRRNIKTLKGTLESGKRGQWVFKPHSNRFPNRFKVVNPGNYSRIASGDAILEITRYPLPGKLPEGCIDIDLSGQHHRMIDQMLISHRIHDTFTHKTVAECDKIPYRVSVKKREGRVDLRELPFVTMDGADARDFDDAVYAERHPEGFRLWVSIADVSSYVTRGSSVDKDARLKGTSVYLPGRVIPMLPEKLSNEVCSLKKGVNRKTLTCEMILDLKGHPRKTTIYQSVNRIAHRLTYDEVDLFYETGKTTHSRQLVTISDLLQLFLELSTILTGKRSKRGALDFSLPETKFIYSDSNRITDIQKTFQTTAQKVIEQFMLEANENVGTYCEKNGIPIIWRNHPPPLPEKLMDLEGLFWRFGLEVPTLQTSRHLNEALKKARTSDHRDILEYATLRSLSLATYETNRQGHFGIAATRYCHFTSPIRRYPDLIVHRSVIDFLKGKKVSKIPSQIAEWSSEMEQNATTTERQAKKFEKMMFLSARVGDVMAAKVVSAQRNGCFIEIDDPYVEGFLPYSAISDDMYLYDEGTQTTRGRATRFIIQRGVRLRVMLTFLDKRYLLPEFSWIEWGEGRE